MLDKLLFNNELLSNKSKVQRAKINVINKLVQKIRKLKKLNESKPNIEKILKKIIKSTDILTCIKKIKNMDLLKRAILNTKNPMAIITNNDSRIEEVADAILFNHKIILQIVKHIKILFNLNESNPGWENEILELSKKQRKILKIEEKQKKRQERKSKNELARKRNEWLEENMKEIDNTKNEIISKIKIEKNTENDIEKINEWKIEDVTPTPTPNSKKYVKEEIKQKKISTENQQKSTSKVNDEDSKNSKCVDPFFITQTGENYLSTVQIKQIQSNANDKKSSQSIFNLKEYNQKNRNSDFKSSNKAKFSKNMNNQNKKGNDLNMNENSLHPSWKAKQKSRGIKEFEGKKMIFNDDDDSYVGDIGNRKNVSTSAIQNKSDTDCNLHPSWAAKQKMKPIIKEFQGTKIVFNNDDN